MRATAEVIETVVRYECPKCGNSCQCGLPYNPKTMRAAKAIEANPEKSNRAIAKEIGVSHFTVNEARKQLEGDIPDQSRTGLDGKTRRIPKRQPGGFDDLPTEEEANESYQITLYDQACLLLESMEGSTRQRFFAFLRDNYDV